MHPAGKVIIGLILIALGLGLFMDEVSPWLVGYPWITSFVTVLAGVIPIMLVLIGLFVVWLEIDEIRAQKELKTETEGKKRKK